MMKPIHNTKLTVIRGRGQSPERPSLTPRQCDVMALAHLRIKEIAYRLGISENTVKIHLTAAYRALGATTRAEAVKIWMGEMTALRRAA